MVIKKSINDNFNLLTNSEKNLSKWIINNDWIAKSIVEISTESGHSISTINRFCKKIGFLGFKEMKALKVFHQKNYNDISVLDNFCVKDIIYSLKETAKSISQSEIDFIGNKIIDKQKIYFYGESFTFIIAQYISRKFSKINFESRALNVSSDLSLIIPIKDAVHIFISNSGRNPNIKLACKKIFASKDKPFIVSITSSNKNNIEKMTNSFINGSFYSSINQDNYELPFVCQYISQYILDAIFNNVYFKKREYHAQIINNISKKKE